VQREVAGGVPDGNWQIYFLSLASEASQRRGDLIFSPSEIAAFGLRPAGPLASLLAPHILPGMLVARALPAGLGASSKMQPLFIDRPLP